MAQQVYRVRCEFTSLSPFIDNPSVDFIIEQTGSNAGLTNSTVMTKITNFWNTTPTGGVRAPAGYISGVISRSAGACLVNMYDITAHLDGSSAGGPVFSSSFTLAANAGTGANLPEGLCLLQGFQSAYGTDVEFGPVGAIPTPPDIISDFGAASTHQGKTRPRSRDRGRLYFGPMSGGWLVNDSQGRPIWSTGSITIDFGNALLEMLTYGGGSDVPALVQWSRRNASVKQITHAWIEDSPRYQRRRADLGNKLTTF